MGVEEQPRRWSKLVVVSLLGGLFTGCFLGEPRNCYPGFDPGEQFRITIKGPAPDNEICDTAPLQAGDSFVLTASNGRISDPSGNGCYTYGAVGTVPDFAKPIITECWPDRDQLGLGCKGVTANGCAITMTAVTGPYIHRDDQVIEDGGFTINWGGCQIPETCGGGEVYSARIERLNTTGDY